MSKLGMVWKGGLGARILVNKRVNYDFGKLGVSNLVLEYSVANVSI